MPHFSDSQVVIKGTAPLPLDKEPQPNAHDHWQLPEHAAYNERSAALAPYICSWLLMERGKLQALGYSSPRAKNLCSHSTGLNSSGVGGASACDRQGFLFGCDRPRLEHRVPRAYKQLLLITWIGDSQNVDILQCRITAGTCVM